MIAKAIRKLSRDLWEAVGLNHEGTQVYETQIIVIHICAALERLANRF